MKNLEQEPLMDRTLRWMHENLDGAYNATYPSEHEKSGQHCTNSGTAILIFCYINILGKVLLKGGPPKRKNVSRDKERFIEFLKRCMPDFTEESATHTFPQTHKETTTGQDWLYKVFRCGFVHQFYPSKTDGWSRFPDSNKYWQEVGQHRVVLNISQLRRGFDDGVRRFRKIVQDDSDLCDNFEQYILKS